MRLAVVRLAKERLIALTASAGVRVIVEIHSDHVLNGIRLTVRQGELKAAATTSFFRALPRARQFFV